MKGDREEGREEKMKGRRERKERKGKGRKGESGESGEDGREAESRRIRAAGLEETASERLSQAGEAQWSQS